MTETARLAHYVLPAASQFEKPEATFFNFEFPHNGFQLRRLHRLAQVEQKARRRRERIVEDEVAVDRNGGRAQRLQRAGQATGEQARVDLAASDDQGGPVISLLSIGPDVPAPA